MHFNAINFSLSPGRERKCKSHNFRSVLGRFLVEILFFFFLNFVDKKSLLEPTSLVAKVEIEMWVTRKKGDGDSPKHSAHVLLHPP